MILNIVLSWIFGRILAAQAHLFDIPEVVNFDVPFGVNEKIRVSLIPIQSFLANENVPVWIQEDEDRTKLTLMKNVMAELTPFTVYQDPKTCAAGLLFHKEKQFEGTIGHHHYMRKLKYNTEEQMVKLSRDTLLTSSLAKHAENRLTEGISKRKNAMDEKKVRYESNREYPNVVYVETLVMIDHDITHELKYDYSAIVKYVLTLFNTVDMLYSTIETPNIKINIAGVIIATSIGSFMQFIDNNCYDWVDYNEDELAMDTECIFYSIPFILELYKIVPPQSYDIVVYLTRSRLFRVASTPTEDGIHYWRKYLFGRANNLRVNRDGYRQSSIDTKIAIVSDRGNLECFPTLAHEIAHTLGVPHDEGFLWRIDGTCDAHLMKKDNSMCRRCLKFAGRTPAFLKKFFGSRDGCIFRNEPRSLLDSPSPKLFWTAHEQCRCYGHETVYRSKATRIVSPAVKCRILLECLDVRQKSEITSLYMDGSPCDESEIGNKVCWNFQCVDVSEDKP